MAKWLFCQECGMPILVNDDWLFEHPKARQHILCHKHARLADDNALPVGEDQVMRVTARIVRKGQVQEVFA